MLTFLEAASSWVERWNSRLPAVRARLVPGDPTWKPRAVTVEVEGVTNVGAATVWETGEFHVGVYEVSSGNPVWLESAAKSSPEGLSDLLDKLGALCH